MSESDIVTRLKQGMKAASFTDWDFERTEADMQEGADTITALRAEVEKLKAAYSITQHDIQQTLGRALNYPWFKDDLTNFPNATEADGVCVGDHVAESLADEAAAKIIELCAKVERLEGALKEIGSITVCSGGDIHGISPTAWRAAFDHAHAVARAALGDTP